MNNNNGKREKKARQNERLKENERERRVSPEHNWQDATKKASTILSLLSSYEVSTGTFHEYDTL